MLREWYLHLLMKHANYEYEGEREECAAAALKMEEQFLPLTNEKDVVKLTRALHGAGFRGCACFLRLLKMDKPDCPFLATCSIPPLDRRSELYEELPLART